MFAKQYFFSPRNRNEILSKEPLFSLLVRPPLLSLLSQGLFLFSSCPKEAVLHARNNTDISLNLRTRSLDVGLFQDWLAGFQVGIPSRFFPSWAPVAAVAPDIMSHMTTS